MTKKSIQELAVAKGQQLVDDLIFSDYGFYIEYPEKNNPTKGWAGKTLVSIWDRSSDLDFGYVIDNGSLKQVY